MGWFFKRKIAPEEKRSILRTEIPKDEERLGPAPPPPPSATPPGVTVLRFGEPTGDAPLAVASARRAAETRLVTIAPGSSAPAPAGAYLVLVGSIDAAGLPPSAAGDLVLAASPLVVASRGADPAVLLADVSSAAPRRTRRVAHDAAEGRGVGGITGGRRFDVEGAAAALRLGPPPGARWAIVGLRSLAVFSGKMTLVDGDEPRDVRAGRLAVIADPAATLYLQAGNDSALAIGFASPDFILALG